jgi:serine/threonine protein kinase
VGGLLSLRTGTAPLPGGYLGIELLGESLGVEAWKALPPDSSATVLWKGCAHEGLGPEILALVREAEALRELTHDGLVKPIHDASRQEQPFLVFPWVKGTVHASRPQDYLPSQVLGVLRESAEKLQAVHRCGWVHGDIRPENLFWSLEGIKLIDFGLARRIGEIAEQAAIHSPEFLAPEARKAGYAWHPSADWYALGKTAYRWLGSPSSRREGAPSNLKGAPLPGGVSASSSRASAAEKATDAAPAGFWGWMDQWTQELPASRLSSARIAEGLFRWEIEWLGRGS